MGQLGICSGCGGKGEVEVLHPSGWEEYGTIYEKCRPCRGTGRTGFGLGGLDVSRSVANPEATSYAPGDKVMVRTATNEWLRKVADSETEGYRTHEQRHDFVGVYVRAPDAEPGDSVFWPIEDVRRGWECLT